jgi:hypothetical protein
MATYRVKAPDGTEFDITAPDGASQEEVMAYAKANMPKPAAKEAPSSPLGTDGQNLLAGIGMGMTNLVRGGKQRLDEAAAALESVVPGGAGVSRSLGGKTAADILKDTQASIAESRATDAPLKQTKAGIAGDIVGSVVPLSVLGPAGAVAGGAASGYLAPTTDGESVLKNTAIGGALGYAGDKAIRGLGRMVSPKTSDAVKQLTEEGVKLTPGQLMGGLPARIEEKATSIPFVGDAIANARRRSVESLNEVAINRSLSPIGEKLPKGMVGRDAIQYADEALGKAYDDLLPKLTTQADKKFIADIQNLRTMVSAGNMGPAEAMQFSKILQSQILGKFQGQASITGETMKAMDSDLGRLASQYMRDASADKRQLGGAIGELQTALRSLVERSNPQSAKELKAINSGWAQFKRVQRAAGSQGAQEGVFSPEQLRASVRALDRSKDKGRFAEGKALMQDLSDPARDVLGSKIPDSGTPARLANMGAGASALIEPSVPIGLLAASGLYSKPMTSLLQSAMTKRGAWAKPTAEQLEALAPYFGLLSAGAAQQVGNQ